MSAFLQTSGAKLIIAFAWFGYGDEVNDTVGKEPTTKTESSRASQRLALLPVLPLIEAKTLVIADAAAAGGRWIIDGAR
jgi:hypothetical protein